MCGLGGMYVEVENSDDEYFHQDCGDLLRQDSPIEMVCRWSASSSRAPPLPQPDHDKHRKNQHRALATCFSAATAIASGASCPASSEAGSASADWEAFKLWGRGGSWLKGRGECERIFNCRSQLTYTHGAQMCTTACMQVAIAMLCQKVDLCSAERAMWSPALVDRVCQDLTWCMEAGNVVHGRVERVLNGDGGRYNDHHGRYHHYHHHHHMLSVNDIVKILGIKLDALHIGTEELIVSARGQCTEMGIRNRRISPSCPDSKKKQQQQQQQQHQGGGKRESSRCMLKYEPASCYISLGHLPVCMELLDSPSGCASSSPPSSSSSCPGSKGSPTNRVSVVIFTANGHSVCCGCYYPAGSTAGSTASYSVFDPLPGRMHVGLCGVRMAQMVKDALRIPARACLWLESKESTLGPGASKRRRGNHGLCGEVFGEGGDGGAANAGLDDFYGDVTVMHLLGD
jgi:hypothetical protein